MVEKGKCLREKFRGTSKSLVIIFILYLYTFIHQNGSIKRKDTYIQNMQ